MSANAYISHRSPDMNNSSNTKVSTNNQTNFSIVKLNYQSRTRTGSTGSFNSFNSNHSNYSNSKSNGLSLQQNSKLNSKSINFDDIPSLSTNISRSSIHLTPLEFAHSIPIFRREKFDLFGVHGMC